VGREEVGFAFAPGVCNRGSLETPSKVGRLVSCFDQVVVRVVTLVRIEIGIRAGCG